MWPLEPLTSLSPAVRADTVGYNNATGDASDRILLTNVLRAKYLAPLDLGQLSSISGTLSLQGSLAFTLPWGHGISGTGLNNAQNVVNPGVMGSTTPTYTYTPLNTEGFILSILQPVSASYVLTQWQAGVSRELLLMLFVKEIDFPHVSKNKDTGEDEVSTKRYINDPDNAQRFFAFQNLVGNLLYAGAELKAIDILDPVGPPFSLYASVGSSVAETKNDYKTTPAGAATPTAPPVKSSTVITTTTGTLADQNGFSLITTSNDGQYHVGNAPSDSMENGGQLYRVYAGQVELCVDSEKMMTAQHPIPQLAPVVPGLKALEKKPKEQSEQTNALSAFAASGKAGGMAANQASGQAQQPSASPHGGAAGQSSGASSGQAMTAALQAGRVSALVSSDGCYADETVLKKFTEQDFQSASEHFVHIQWRSVSEIFDYLGAVLRYQARTGSPVNLVWTDEALQDSTIRYASAFDAPGVPPLHEVSPLNASPQIFFAVYKDGSSDIRASYNSESVAPNEVDPANPRADGTMPILSMLSTLVDYASQPGTISTSAPLRLLPIP